MHILPRKEFDSKEVAETDYLVIPDPNATNASCQVHISHSIDEPTINAAGVALIILLVRRSV